MNEEEREKLTSILPDEMKKQAEIETDMAFQLVNVKRCFMCLKLTQYRVKSEFSGATMLDGYQCPKGVMVNPYNFACDEIELNDKYNTQ